MCLINGVGMIASYAGACSETIAVAEAALPTGGEAYTVLLYNVFLALLTTAVRHGRRTALR
jgi:hypothetical protein